MSSRIESLQGRGGGGGNAQGRRKLAVEHRQLHNRLIIDKGELQLADLDAHHANRA